MMIVQASNAANPNPPNPKILTTTNIAIPKSMADCARFTGTATMPTGPGQFATAFCSLPVDPKGIYKTIWMSACLPSNLVTQERATAAAVLASYTVPKQVLQGILSPFDAPPAPPVLAGGGGAGGSGLDATTAAILAETRREQEASQQQFNCFDEGVMREEPEWRLPPYCH